MKRLFLIVNRVILGQAYNDFIILYKYTHERNFSF